MQQGPYKILVVDDEVDLEPLFLQRMRRLIRSKRYTFVFAHNGLEALDKLSEDSDIDMVLSDINMPQMDGLTLLEQIPKIDPNMRAVIISAYGDMQNIRTAMNRGAFDFVTKPLDFKDLQITMERTLQHIEEWKDALSSRDRLVALENELDVASKMQQSILPTQFPEGLDYKVFGHMRSARNVGGDFFDVMRLANGKIGLAIADVSDKGVPAALFMMSCRTLLKGAAIGQGKPSDVVKTVNDLLVEDNEASMFVTLLYAEYDPESRRLTYSNGGHNFPFVIHADGSSAVLPSTNGIALGVVEDMEYQQNTITLSEGDTIVMYTDGVTEAVDSEGEEFGMDRLLSVFGGSSPTDPEKASEIIFKAVDAFAGDNPQFDDVTCLTLCIG